ncbi:hypothetical protein [Acrocarpospora catenulata]|uniref:hypothetical protein n=1 Tax=Acrocarpospora catenulata TaxID=2836182 RepID=UPI001BDAE48E|nr:hypothetical protein [Acrocarpospora catenulata]
MLADDRARHAHGSLPLACALVHMSAPGEPAPARMALADSAVTERVERLLTGPRPGPRWVSATVYFVGIVLLSGPITILVAPVLCGIPWPG